MELTVYRYDLALPHPLTTATTTLSRRQGWVLRLSDGECSGWGEAAVWPGFATGPEGLARAVADSGVWSALAGGAPAPPELRFAWETAQRDLQLRVAGQAAAACNVPIAGIVRDGAPAPRDVPVVKIKAEQNPETSAERVRALIERRPGLRVRVDANGAWDAAGTIAFWRAVPQNRIDWIEQPLPADDIDGLARLASAGLPIALDEALLGVRPPQEICEQVAAVAWVLKPMFLGGEHALRLGRMAAEAGFAVAVTHTCEGTIGRIAAAHVAADVATAPSGLWPTGLPCLCDEPVCRDGRLHLKPRAGLGIRGVRTDLLQRLYTAEVVG